MSTDPIRLAVLLSETGRTDKAFTLLRNWTVQSPQNADARVELARLYEESGDSNSATTALNEALALDMRNWRAHAALGRIKEQAGDYPQALQNYQLAYSINRYQPELQQHIASNHPTATGPDVRHGFCCSWPAARTGLEGLRTVLTLVPGVSMFAGPAISVVLAAGDAARGALCEAH